MLFREKDPGILAWRKIKILECLSKIRKMSSIPDNRSIYKNGHAGSPRLLFNNSPRAEKIFWQGY
jgi:hypothetical protein